MESPLPFDLRVFLSRVDIDACFSFHTTGSFDPHVFTEKNKQTNENDDYLIVSNRCVAFFHRLCSSRFNASQRFDRIRRMTSIDVP